MHPIDKFHYVPNEDVEDICLCKPGGYHPVKLGDTFQGQGNSKYRVLQKLGSGSFATIWLAKDLPNGYGIVQMRLSLFSMTSATTLSRCLADNSEIGTMLRLKSLLQMQRQMGTKHSY